VKLAFPKSANGSGVHSLVAPAAHSEGASATHSAVLVSGDADVIVSVRLLVWCELRSVMYRLTLSPLTAVRAQMLSPGLIVSASFTGADGTSSYQA
jgi:hypothetical protein